MPAKKTITERPGAPRPRPGKGYVKTAYDTITSSDNASMVRATAAFGVSVLFLSSSWAEYLLPPA